MSNRLVDYGFSSDEEGNNIVCPKKIPNVDVGRLILPNILPTTPWEVQDEWEVADQLPLLDETSFSSAAPSDTISNPLEPQTELTLDQVYMVGGGKKNKVEFTNGECRRAFRGVVFCRNFVPTKKASDLSST